MAETTLYVIVYDIPSDRRRTKVHKTLCGYGEWTQYSVFECWLTKQHLVELRAKLNAHLIPAQDTVRFYPLCQNCTTRTITVGSAPPKDPVTYLL